MSQEPLLILQMQRMGDLILTFPLLLDLQKLWPGHPIWVVAEEVFFQPLLPVSPTVTFFSPKMLDSLRHKHFAQAINLSFRPEAAKAMATLAAEKRLGAVQDHSGLYIHGFWQLYRHSLTQNNRHNTLHWADLNRLDLTPSLADLPKKHRALSAAQNRRLGLVLGASETAKHPDLSFWIVLTRALIREGYLPFFFGGSREKAMGEALAKAVQLPKANLAGKLNLTEVAAWFKTLALCISPDTGPMHLADWLGVPVLNLSMGPVRAHETGPYSPGQWVLMPKMSCAGCWECPRQLRCKKKFLPSQIVRAINLFFAQQENPEPTQSFHNIGLWQSTHKDGFFHLMPLELAQPNAQRALDAWLRELFFALYEPANFTQLNAPSGLLWQHFPSLANLLARHLQTMLKEALLGFKKSQITPDFLRQALPALRLLAGFLEMYLQNSQAKPIAWKTVLNWLSEIVESFSTARN
ncbi:MAG: glycosyltransferase family 9 protein [Desulfovibrio sp.]|nr:glycosyltransferase family 9 protein [Desulfovibrio sp.]